MIRDDAKIIITPTSVLLKEALTSEEINEAHIYRGYDVTTMKFEISPKLPNYERFNGLSEKYYGKKK